MNLDELQSVQARERQSSDLQHLRSSFYREVGEFVRDLTEERARIVESADDPFSSPEVRQLTDDIETAEQTVEAIYERRVGKVVKKASIAAASMPVDDEGLTTEEEALFEDLVARIEENRATVLSVLDGEVPAVSPSRDGEESPDASRTAETGSSPDVDEGSGRNDAGDDAGGVSAADLMGGDSDGSPAGETRSDRPSPDPSPGESQGPAPESPVDDPLAADATSDDSGGKPQEPAPPGETASGATVESGDEERPAPTASERAVPGIPRTTVRITADVGVVVGVDDRDYELGPEDVVTLPEPNAEVLLEKDAAERLE
jgi:DNA replication factor GINS